MLDFYCWKQMMYFQIVVSAGREFQIKLRSSRYASTITLDYSLAVSIENRTMPIYGSDSRNECGAEDWR